MEESKAVRTDLSLFREDPPKPDEPKLSLAELREKARNTLWIDGIDEMGIGLFGLATGLYAAYGGGEQQADLQADLIVRFILPIILFGGPLFMIAHLLKKHLVVPRVGKLKPPGVPFAPYGIYGMILLASLMFIINQMPDSEHWHSLAAAMAAQLFSTATFVWVPRFFIYPLALVTLLWLNPGLPVVLISMGLIYLLSGIRVFKHFMSSTLETLQEEPQV